MAIKTLFISLDQVESTSEKQNIRDRYDRFKEKTKKFDDSQLSQEEGAFANVMASLDTYLNRYDSKNNANGGYSIVSVTPVLGTETEKVDKDEPMLPLVHTTGFMVILHRDGE